MLKEKKDMSTEKKFELDLEELEQVNGGVSESLEMQIPKKSFSSEKKREIFNELGYTGVVLDETMHDTMEPWKE